MKTSAERYQYNHNLSQEQLKEIRLRIYEGDSLISIAEDMGIRHDVVCCAAEQIIKELKSPVYVPEITEQDIYNQELPAIWRLPQIKAPKDFKGIEINNTFERSN